MTGTGLEIRPFTSGDDLEPELALRRRAFGVISAGDRPRWRASIQASVDAGEIFGAFDHGRLVASARYFSMQQWWHGRAMPMAGVAGVKVAPEERGRGVGRAIMSELLAEIARQGYPVATLYPSTLPIYRSLGWEIAGRLYEAEISARGLGALAGPDPALGGTEAGVDAPGIRPATSSDAAEVVEVLGRVHRELRHCGPDTRRPEETARRLDDEDHFAYLAADGVLGYCWSDGHEELWVDVLAAGSAGTSRAFWGILASHATMARTIRARLAPDDPVTWLLREPDIGIGSDKHWMLRLVDPVQAIAGRGFPANATLSVQLELTDEARPGNSGRWRLEVGGGAGELAPATGPGGGTEDGPVLRTGARGFAALFAGAPVAALRRAGLVTAGDLTADDALDCAFGGTAFMIDYF